jgi:uroporphyrinogen-III synthase
MRIWTPHTSNSSNHVGDGRLARLTERSEGNRHEMLEDPRRGARKPMNQKRTRKKTRRPLTGLRILVGRARHQASALSAGLRKKGARVLEIPFIEIRKPRSFQPLDQALQNLRHYDWLILTSANGVEAMWERIEKLGLNQKNLYHLHIAAIGPATKKSIEKHGLKVDVIPAQYVAESVVRTLHSRVKEKRVLLVRAKVARDVIPHELRAAGAQVDVVEAYETVVPKSSRSRLRRALKDPRRRPSCVTFTSSSTVRNFVELLGLKPNAHKPEPTLIPPSASMSTHSRTHHHRLLEGIKLASIGPVTSATLREFNLPVDLEAHEYTIPGLIKAIALAQEKERSARE